MSSISLTEEFEPDPNEEDYEEQFLPMEIHPQYGIVFRYYTPEEVLKREQRYKEMERLMGPQPQRSKPIIEDDAYYALYESDMYKGPETQNPEVDPSLTERNLGPIVLTPEEEEFYNGPEVSVSKEEGFENGLAVSDQSLVASTSNSKVPTPLLNARIQALQDRDRGHLTPQLEPNPGGISMAEIGLSANLFKYVLWRITHLAQARLVPTDPLRSQGPGKRIECEENFRFKPGDVFMFLELRTQDEGAQPRRVQSFVNIHKDANYFEDYGQYRQNFMDTYGPLFDGDMVLRFGNFNKAYIWRQHRTINFYVYYSNVKPLETSGSTSFHPWYWVEPLRFPVKLDHHTMSVGIGEPRAAQHMPIGTIMPYFRLRDGDILMTYVWDTIEPRFDRMRTFVWNPLLENIGVNKFVHDQDRVLRYGMRYEDMPCGTTTGDRVTVAIAEIEAELYCFRNSSVYDKKWVFLGRSSHKFVDHLLRGHLRFEKVKQLWQVPIAGDILFDRGLRFTLDPDPAKREGPPRRWFPELNIGGLVSFHISELLKDYGLEPRPFVRLTDTGKYGVGNITMALRFGNFKDPKGAPESSTWTWQERKTVELYVLNTRGSSWSACIGFVELQFDRRAAVQVWPDELPRPIPNYFWEPNNIHDITEVSPRFEPRPGDIIIRLDINYEWRSQKADPLLVGSTYNPHYDVDIQMGIFGPNVTGLQQGDFLVRAGYEKNEIKPSWTNATVELYYHEAEDNSPSPWKFRGRDAYIFGTNYWQDGLGGVQQSGFGNLKVSDIEKLNSFDRREFVELDPSEVWRERSIHQALK